LIVNTERRKEVAKVLITGASGGFGKLTVTSLLKCGHGVVAAMRDISGKNGAVADDLAGAGAKVVELDVADDGSAAAGVSKALEALGDLDVVVNNAGLGVLGVQESFTADDWQRLFNVNVFGVHRVIRAVLPHMRARRAGLFVQVSSLLGRIAVPFYGPYNASKWALEAMSENYRVELSRFGIDVVIVEPGGYPTTFIDNLMRPSDQSRDTSLGTMPQDARDFLHHFEEALTANPAQDPQNVADAIVKLIEAPAGQRPFRTIVDKMGMGSAIQPYNDQLDAVTSGIYSAFGIGQMRQLQSTTP
jgi:NAD(P)-dependent dehydrogenase (short-subunit alcohol dehydrogenase family)